MPSDVRILELVERVLEQETTAEIVCVDCPELIPQVKDRLAWCERVDEQLAAIFPSTQTNRDIRVLGPMPIPDIAGYAVTNVIGRGGIGIVYRARQLTLDREVALKMLLAGEFASAIEQARFMREARTIAALRHPNIVQIFDFGDHNGRPFFTMELLEGGTLAEKLEGRRLPPREAAVLLATLAETMHAAHRVGIVHRDLKPANVLLTREGTPKISDFGLARQIDGNSALTLDGAVAGTPSYMSPEQAGQSSEITAATDIYSLGSMLYEMLVGKLPFVGSTSAATQQMVLETLPVPPSQRNPRTPRDLETICLKCLEKAPAKRYETAAELADDLYRFVRGEPVHARRASVIERFGKWVHRRPAAASALAAIVLLAMGLAYGLGRYEQLQSQRRLAIESDLAEIRHCESVGDWDSARTVLLRAEARLENAGPADMREHVDHAQRDLALVSRLDAIHLRRATSGGLLIYRKMADRDYAAAFVQAGLFDLAEAPEVNAGRLADSPIAMALVAALDDWTLSAGDVARRKWLLSVAHNTNPVAAHDDAVRELTALPDTTNLTQPTADLDIQNRSVSALVALGERLTLSGRTPFAFLRRVQQEHPADFWANLALGDALLLYNPVEAAVFYRTALAARPNVAVGYCAVGDALERAKQPGLAVEYYDRALRIDSRFARAENNRGHAMLALGRTAEAFACSRRTLEIDPDYAWAHCALGYAYASQKNWEQAEKEFKIILEACPDSPEVQNIYRSTLMHLGRIQNAWQEWKDALDNGLVGFDAWNGYAELSLYLNRPDEYHRACDALIRQFGQREDPRVTEPVARACLMQPRDAASLAAAIAVADRAVAAERANPSQFAAYTSFVEGLAAYRRGDLDRSIDILTHEAAKVLGPAPKLVCAMALYDKGDLAAANGALAAGIASFNWSESNAERRDKWLNHILRRQAEAKIHR